MWALLDMRGYDLPGVTIHDSFQDALVFYCDFNPDTDGMDEKQVLDHYNGNEDFVIVKAEDWRT